MPTCFRIGSKVHLAIQPNPRLPVLEGLAVLTTDGILLYDSATMRVDARSFAQCLQRMKV